MQKYEIVDSNGNVNKVSYIGANHTADGTFIDNYASAYDWEITNDDIVCIENNMSKPRYCTIGNVTDAYRILKNEIQGKNPRNVFEYTECVQNTVTKYFGNDYNIRFRLLFFPHESQISSPDKRCKVSDLAHKNIAGSVERAMLAHNLLFELNFNPVFKISSTLINGEVCVHAYNLISVDGKNYIFDATIPTILDYQLSPLICEISDEIHDSMKSASPDIGYSVRVAHPGLLRDYDIIYDAGREKEYTYKKVG